MLQVVIPGGELYDNERGEFLVVKETKLQLEHSLISISKWESKHEKAFNSGEQKTNAETLDYVRCMTINQNVDLDVYKRIPGSVFRQIQEYILSPMTATEVPEPKKKSTSKEIWTSELIYYYMFSFNIPLECEKWHLNRLITLIKLFSHKNQATNTKDKGKKAKPTAMSLRERDALNRARRAKLGSKG